MAANPDIVKVLSRLLAQTPDYAYYCRPLPRATVASIIQEIEMLRDQVAAAGRATTEASETKSI